MEASLLQLYAPRDPLAEVLAGEITIRQFRVMCEGIPRTPDTPVGRALHGPWADRDRLLHMATSVLQQLRADVAAELAEGAVLMPVPYIPADTAVQRVNITMERGLLRAIDETAKSRGMNRSSFLASAARRELIGT